MRGDDADTEIGVSGGGLGMKPRLLHQHKLKPVQTTRTLF